MSNEVLMLGGFQPYALLPASVSQEETKHTEEEIEQEEPVELGGDEPIQVIEIFVPDPEINSKHQPQTDTEYFTIEEYAGYKGLGLSFMSHMRDESKFLDESDHWDKKRLYTTGWSSIGSYEAKENPYFPFEIRNQEQARAAIDNFHMPKEIRSEAMRASSRLYDVFAEVAALHRVYNLPSGRFDMRKAPKVAEAIAAGTYDANKLLPFRRTETPPVKKPTVAIVASCGNAEMWSNPMYVPRILRITLGVQWACEAAGLNVWAALMEGHAALDKNAGYAESVWAHIICEPGMTTPMKVYGSMLHVDLWRWAGITVEAADWKAHEIWKKLVGYSDYGQIGYGGLYLSRNGGYAVKWAREVTGADLVISIGNIRDRHQADIQLDGDWDLNVAVGEIIKQARKKWISK